MISSNSVRARVVQTSSDGFMPACGADLSAWKAELPFRASESRSSPVCAARHVRLDAVTPQAPVECVRRHFRLDPPGVEARRRSGRYGCALWFLPENPGAP